MGGPRCRASPPRLTLTDAKGGNDVHLNVKGPKENWRAQHLRVATPSSPASLSPSPYIIKTIVTCALGHLAPHHHQTLLLLDSLSRCIKRERKVASKEAYFSSMGHLSITLVLQAVFFFFKEGNKLYASIELHFHSPFALEYAETLIHSFSLFFFSSTRVL